MTYPAASTALAEAFESRSETETRLHGYWLVPARILCLTLCVLSVGLYFASVQSYVANHFCMGAASNGCSLYLPYVWTHRRANNSRAWPWYIHHRSRYNFFPWVLADRGFHLLAQVG